VALSGVARAQKAKPQEPPEEDERLQQQEYAFNPLQASKELKVGNFYFKKGSYRAAIGRFEEAVKWNPSFAEAYLRMGEAQEKLANEAHQRQEKERAMEAARKAYAKFLELAPDDKKAEEIKKKVGK
jgi:tetratricopeptide (TPR) repeat protein